MNPAMEGKSYLSVIRRSNHRVFVTFATIFGTGQNEAVMIYCILSGTRDELLLSQLGPHSKSVTT